VVNFQPDCPAGFTGLRRECGVCLKKSLRGDFLAMIAGFSVGVVICDRLVNVGFVE